MNKKDKIILNLKLDKRELESKIEVLKTKIKEYMEIKGLQELIADFKHTGKEGLILDQKIEIAELTKSVMSLTGKNLKLKEEIKRLKTVIMDKFDYSETLFNKLYRKLSKGEINENEKLKEEIKKLKILIEDKESVESVFLEPDDPNYKAFKEMRDKIYGDENTKAGKKDV